MSSIFFSDFYSKLKVWTELKEHLSGKPLETICVETDRFWQQCPLLSHYLHPADVDDWPNPWELLSENNYCVYARALGMVYTLLLLGIESIDFVDALDNNKENVVLVVVGNQYVLNYWPNTVLENKISDFAISTTISIETLKKKIQ